MTGIGGGSCRSIPSQKSFGPSAVVFSTKKKVQNINNSYNTKINNNNNVLNQIITCIDMKTNNVGIKMIINIQNALV